MSDTVMMLDVEKALDIVKLEYKRLLNEIRECDKYAKGQYKAYDEKIEALSSCLAEKEKVIERYREALKAVAYPFRDNKLNFVGAVNAAQQIAKSALQEGEAGK